jgi:outer membrane protein
LNKYLIFVILITISVAKVAAQKFGYVDSEYITSKMPEYKKAQEEMTKYTEKWTTEIAAKYQDLEKMQRAYRVEEILLSDEMRQSRQKAIADKENEAKEYNNKVFGFEGLLFQKKKELIKPSLDLIYQALQKIARSKQLMFIFDKAADGMMMLYTDPRHDYTDYVLEELGLDKEKAEAKAEKK